MEPERISRRLVIRFKTILLPEQRLGGSISREAGRLLFAIV
jgi:hypothetical protein